MAYTLKIERSDDALITLEEWESAVEQTEGVRLCTHELHTTAVPKSGAVLSMNASPGDAEIYDDASQRWHFCFRMSNGAIEFNARVVYRALDGDLSDPLWLVVRKLADQLNAIITGEEGEIYDENAKGHL